MPPKAGLPRPAGRNGWARREGIPTLSEQGAGLGRPTDPRGQVTPPALRANQCEKKRTVMRCNSFGPSAFSGPIPRR